MKGTTHIIGGLAAAVITTQGFDISVQQPMIFYSSALIGAIIPDICHPKSMLGRRIPIISKSIHRVFGHRAITHSLLFVIGLAWLLNQLSFGFAADLQAGILAGVISHIILDAMTPRGVKLLYPLQTSFQLPLHNHTGSKLGETIIGVSLLFLTVALLAV
ncbi:metal-dependent hydrolase [Halalkalibacter oceani]|uniref:Metal-dependent hydrolase n=1 Tax=Halalkalibacter oceani TaxID=1653776 RepID=A0A9X2DMD9_9BACI|nr:metal-dependent hydrolase [Halalkalibacter oceani]MCM3713456.1 metal-dependent hydrolase [Halalkalibacter oceani]